MARLKVFPKADIGFFFFSVHLFIYTFVYYYYSKNERRIARKKRRIEKKVNLNMTIDREKFSLMSNWYRNDQAGKSSNSIDSLNRVKIEAISIEINRLGF